MGDNKNKAVQTKAKKPPKRDKALKNINGGSGKMIFSIRNKIILCFLVPILFMIVIGAAAYRQASEGMSEKFRDSTTETISMATEYIDMSCSFIETEGISYAFDNDLVKYYVGLMNDDPVAKMSVTDSTKTSMMASQTSNPFVQNIHIITKEGLNIFTTATGNNVEGFFEEYKETAPSRGRGIVPWIDGHDLLDEKLGLKKEDYILSYETMSKTNNACIVIDIKTRTIRDFLDSLDLGEGSIIGFVTMSGREVISENIPEGGEGILAEGETVFFGQDFFPPMDEEAKENSQGAWEVTFHGQQYLFIYSRSVHTDTTVCALVPMEIIIGQAESIKTLTFWLVVLACIIVLLLGLLTVTGIQRNMNGISRKFGEVAKGDLTVRVMARGRDEFQGLAGSANNMIENTKKLVDKVTSATVQLEASAKDVEQVSGVINSHSVSITRAVNEISDTMTQQTANVEECVAKTDILSEEMQEVSRVVENVGRLVDETEEMIAHGMEIIRLLGDRAQQTTDITAKVGESIESLQQESDIINSFVGTITDISEQTNLLSLNASIEAARAGEAGRGFAVVAEEIRKLADDSAKAAGEISNNVEHITAQTMKSVDSAREASSMVASQTEAVEQVVSVFHDMQERMKRLVSGLDAIIASTEKADEEKNYTVAAIRQISESIEETTNSAMTVRDAAEKLMESVEGLTQTADSLGENMHGLTTEVAVFKI